MKNLSEYDSVTENTTPHIKTTTPYFKIFTNALSDCKLIIKRVSVFGEREKCFFFQSLFLELVRNNFVEMAKVDSDIES